MSRVIFIHSIFLAAPTSFMSNSLLNYAFKVLISFLHVLKHFVRSVVDKKILYKVILYHKKLSFAQVKNIIFHEILYACIEYVDLHHIIFSKNLRYVFSQQDHQVLQAKVDFHYRIKMRNATRLHLRNNVYGIALKANVATDDLLQISLSP